MRVCLHQTALARAAAEEVGAVRKPSRPVCACTTGMSVTSFARTKNGVMSGADEGLHLGFISKEVVWDAAGAMGANDSHTNAQRSEQDGTHTVTSVPGQF